MKCGRVKRASDAECARLLAALLVALKTNANVGRFLRPLTPCSAGGWGLGSGVVVPEVWRQVLTVLFWSLLFGGCWRVSRSLSERLMPGG